ncbi:MAG: histidine kinase [Pelosinus sp.]|nr:histidine kinase [Pelosinus sp.]
MNSKTIKWFSSLLAAIIIGIIEFVRHQFLHVISMDWGNLIVAAATGVLVLIYFHGIFALLENLYGKLQQEKEETAVLQERYRIARDLHDNVAQTLFFLNVKINEVEKKVQEQGVYLDAIGEIKDAIKMTDEDLRKYIFILQNDVRDIMLVDAIQGYLIKYEAKNHIKVNLEIVGDVEQALAQNVKKRLFRIFQELLANVQKHAGTEDVYIKLEALDKKFSMVICDHGIGFMLNDLNSKRLSFGLKNIEEDAKAIDAKLKVSSAPGTGTTVIVSLIVRQEECDHEK